MNGQPRIGLLGGTFDPIHAGHLAVARAAQHALGLSEVRFLPSRIPPHRSEPPAASGYHRFAMVALATMSEATWRVSDAELVREGPSYTYDTLAALHGGGLHPSQIFFIIGADAFAEIATWSRFPAVLDAAHFAVVQRAGMAVRALRDLLPSLSHRMVTPDSLGTGPFPRVVLLDAEPPDVSSTEVRRRARVGTSVSSLVPEPVAAYIARHGLYAFAREGGGPTGLSLEGRLHGED